MQKNFIGNFKMSAGYAALMYECRVYALLTKFIKDIVLLTPKA